MKLLNLVLDDFQDIELINFNAVLQKSDFLTKNDFFNPHEKKLVEGQFKIANIKTKIHINLNDYDAIFIPGGKAAIFLRNDLKSLNIIKDFIEKKKTIIMICDAPNALYENNLIPKEVLFTSYPINNKYFLSNNQIVKQNVYKYENFYSAKAAQFAIDLALLVIENFGNINQVEKIRNNLNGN